MSASDSFADDLAAALTAGGVDTASMAAWPRFRTLIGKLSDGTNFGGWKPSEDEHRFVLAIADDLMARLATAQTADAAFWCQMLKSTKQQAEVLQCMDGGKITNGDRFFNLRDGAMGDNLNWLAREAFPRRKIIVWAANLHNMRNVRVLAPSISKWRVMGDHVWDAFGDKIYSIGFTAHGGARAWHDHTMETPIEPPMPDSIEDLWGATTHQNAFVDLRNVAAGGEWLNSAGISSLFNGFPAIAEWNKLVDGVVFLRTMQRAARVE
jgi:erythromycin esterase